MTALTVAAVVLAAGWTFVRRWLQTRYIVIKETGHPQYFTAGVAAVCLFTLGACLHHFTQVTFDGYSRIEQHFVALIPQLDQSRNLAEAAECAGWTLLLSLVLPWIYNIPITRNSILLTAVLKKVGAYDAIDRLYAHSLEHTIPLAFTLKSRKVYIGFAYAGPSLLPDIERTWVELFPLLSGYRNAHAELVTGTNYMSAYAGIRRREPEQSIYLINQFKVVLPFSEIVSIQAFNVEKGAEWFDSDEAAQSAVGEALGVEAAEAQSTTEQENALAWGVPLGSPEPLYSDELRFMNAYRGFYILCALAVALLAYDVRVSLVTLLLAALFGTASADQSGDEVLAD